MDKKYINRVELHCHTGFSENDGTASVRDIINFAVREGISSVAFTDHGNVMAYPEIQSYVSKHEGFKPIYGIEAYVVNDIDMLGDNLEECINESLDKDVVVFDIETTGFSPVINEIIEIGAIKLNSSRKMIDEFSELVKPQVYHEMHRITSKLIHLQMNQLQQGSFFPEVMKQFQDWCGDDYIFCTWGPLDLVELQRNIRYYGLEPLADGPFR